MTRTALSALLSHWWRNPMQLFTLLAGLALATALWSGVQAVNAEARASYDSAASTLGEAAFEQLVSGDDRPIDQATYVELRRGGWLVSDPLTAPGGIGPVDLQGGADVGAFISAQGQVFGSEQALAAFADLDVETVASPDIAPGVAYTDIGVAQRLLDREGQIDLIVIAPLQPVRQTPLDQIAPDLIRRAAQSGTDVAQLTDSFHLNLTAFGLLSFAVGIFIVNGAIGLAFEQRRPVVRTLRALGMPLNRMIWCRCRGHATTAVQLVGVWACHRGWRDARGCVRGFVEAGAYAIVGQRSGACDGDGSRSEGKGAGYPSGPFTGHSIRSRLYSKRIDRRFCFPWRFADWCCASTAADPERGAGVWGAAQRIGSGAVVLGRHPATAAGAVTGADGATACYGGKRWCFDNGVQLSVNLCRFSGPTACLGTLCLCAY